ncbi:MAG: hypothetical protein GTO60_07910, partial [Gammaproteobacteria bacterium]|nr:hypothetical protein [Gammaproteobacteria bacterium]
MLAIILLIIPLPSIADHPGDMEGHEHEEVIDDTQAQIVEYPASFFQRYRPNTALDMV